jgi:hypothetical protein
VAMAKGLIRDNDNKRAEYVLMRAQADAELAIALSHAAVSNVQAGTAVDEARAVHSGNAPAGTPPTPLSGVMKNEMENSMRFLKKTKIVTTGSLLTMLVAACASTPAPQELLDARSAYQRAQSGPATQFKPDQVHEAKAALDTAEQSYIDDPSDQKTKDLSYVAQRKAELADANAANAQALSVKGAAENDTKQTTKGQLAQTRQQLA